MLLFYLGWFYCSLFCPKSVRITTHTKVMQKLWCSKLLKHYNKKGRIIRRFLLFLFPYIRFLFESVKLIKQFSSRFDQISGCSNVLKYFNIFQKFLPISKFFLLHVNVSDFLPCTKGVFSWTKPIIPVAQNGRNITWKC